MDEVFCWVHDWNPGCSCPPAFYPQLAEWPSRMYYSLNDLETFND